MGDTGQTPVISLEAPADAGPRVGWWRRILRGPWETAIIVLTIVVLGGMVSAYKFSLIRNTTFIGHADNAAYANMAKSLAAGRGHEVNYISWFFIPYAREITRREDHWPPFLSWLMAPFVWKYGPHAWACRIAPILVGSVGLPLAAAALGYAFSRRAWVGLASGLMMMCNKALFDASLVTLSDVSYAMLVTAFCAAVIAATRRPWWHLAAGILAGLAYYAKGSGLVFVALYPVLAGFSCGWRVYRDTRAWAGFCAAVIAVAPWLGSNWDLYGNPLHSTQNYASGYIGILSWEEGTYRPYWGRDLPKTSDRWTKHAENYPGRVAAYREAAVRSALLGTGVKSREWSKFGREGVLLRGWLSGKAVREKDLEKAAWTAPREWTNPVGTLSGMAATVLVAGVALLSVLALPFLLVKFVLRLRKRGGDAEAGISTMRRLLEKVRVPALAGPTLVLLIVLLTTGWFIVHLWEAQERFFYPFAPLVAVMGCTVAAVALDLPLLRVGGWWLRGWRILLVTALAGVALYSGLVRGGEWKARYEALINRAKYPYADKTETPGMGEFVRENLPTATVMTRFPWQLQFYLGESNRTVNIPLAPPETIFAIARYYGVTHYINDCRRPGMELYVSQSHPGLVPVTNAPGPLFEMKLDLLPGGTATVSSLQEWSLSTAEAAKDASP